MAVRLVEHADQARDGVAVGHVQRLVAHEPEVVDELADAARELLEPLVVARGVARGRVARDGLRRARPHAAERHDAVQLARVLEELEVHGELVAVREVHLAQHVDVGELEAQHRRQRQEARRDVVARHAAVRDVDEVRGDEPRVEGALEVVEDAPQAPVVREELRLARQVEDDVGEALVDRQLLDLVAEPGALLQLLHAEEERAVRAQALLGHGAVHTAEVAHVDGEGRQALALAGRVQVHERHRPLRQRVVAAETGAHRALARARRAHDDAAKEAHARGGRRPCCTDVALQQVRRAPDGQQF